MCALSVFDFLPIWRTFSEEEFAPLYQMKELTAHLSFFNGLPGNVACDAIENEPSLSRRTLCLNRGTTKEITATR